MASPEAGQALRNNMVELNNWRRPMAQNINQVIGPKQVTQANDPTFDFFTFRWMAGKASIKPQIIAWPYATDDDGCAFDTANIWGVRFFAYNPEQNAVIAVPKVLPVGYTATIDRGGWQSQQIGISTPVDYFSSDGKATWTNTGNILSTIPSRFYLRAPPAQDAIAKDWGPMNWASLSAIASLGSGGFYGSSGGTATYITPLNDDHIGYRRVRIRLNQGGKGATPYAQPKVYVGYTAVGAGLTYPTVPTVVFSNQFQWTDLIVDTGTSSHAEVMCTTAQAPVIGTRVKWWMWAETTTGPLGSFALGLSSRTDVPFPFDVVGLGDGTSSDWHAPGGYV